jgi:hypothetical protein
MARNLSTKSTGADAWAGNKNSRVPQRGPSLLLLWARRHDTPCNRTMLYQAPSRQGPLIAALAGIKMARPKEPIGILDSGAV